MTSLTPGKRNLVIAVVVCSIIAIYGGWGDASPPVLDAQTQPTISQGEALVGGAFTLIDQQGVSYTDAQLAGHWSLVFFGFTHCPDICPTALGTMSQALQQWDAKHPDQPITPVFITLDPERDTPATLQAYASNFHPRLVALTGSLAQVDTAAKAYKVYYQKTPLGDSAAEYTVDHSGYIYLMNPQGRYHAHFAYSITPDELNEKLEGLIQ